MNEFMGRLTLPGIFPSSTSLRRSSADLLTYVSMSATGTCLQSFVNSLSGFSSFATFSAFTFSFFALLGFGDLSIRERPSGIGFRFLGIAYPLLVLITSWLLIDGVVGDDAGVLYWSWYSGVW
jgi:hypothetical protein